MKIQISKRDMVTLLDAMLLKNEAQQGMIGETLEEAATLIEDSELMERAIADLSKTRLEEIAALKQEIERLKGLPTIDHSNCGPPCPSVDPKPEVKINVAEMPIAVKLSKMASRKADTWTGRKESEYPLKRAMRELAADAYDAGVSEQAKLTTLAFDKGITRGREIQREESLGTVWVVVNQATEELDTRTVTVFLGEKEARVAWDTIRSSSPQATLHEEEVMPATW